MSKEKPPTQLVGWKKYLSTTADRGIFTCFACVVLCLGSCLLIWAVPRVLVSLWVWNDVREAKIGFYGTCGGLWMIKIALNWVKEARQIAPVALLTKSSAKRLPEVETLVRGSDRPATQQQAELLRAVKSGQETPPEELLRATQGIKDNEA